MSEKPDESNVQPVDDRRRRFCQNAIGGMSLVSLGTVGYPVVTFLKLPKSLQQEESIEISLDELSEDAAHWGQRMGQQIVVVKVGGKPLAFNGACPHLGCVVQWDGATHTFKCPCHGAVFSDQGKPIQGPVNAPLASIPFEIIKGKLKIS